MFAVVKVGSSQYKISEGDVIEVNRINEEEGKTVILDKVLMFVDDSDVRIGQPYLKDVKVEGKITDQFMDKKKIAFKFKKREDHQLKKGHRQKLTKLNITKILK